jgi:hypothetical protein
MLRRIAAFILVSTIVAAQNAAPAKPKPPTPEERWLHPAQRVTAAIDSDLWRMPRHLHAMTLANLASIWWKDDASSARKWIETAVDDVTLVPANEAEPDRALRLRGARVILSLLTPSTPVCGRRWSTQWR